ncbi:MAG: hypothetical protein HC897_19515 [Thermoanaerobaculia bacterium]|nr:hypothetical protein [Thermoanaerobaculia bacterium]
MTTWNILRFSGTALLMTLLGVGCASAQITPPCAGESLSFTSIWNADLPPTKLTMGEGFDELLGQMQTLWTEGFLLDDFEVWESYGVQQVAGLFRPGQGARLLLYDMDAATFQAQRHQRFVEGLRLLDVEILWVEGERRFSALWASGTGTERVYDNLEASEFHAEWQDLSSSYRLVDFETWWADDELRVFGVFRTGYEETEELVFGLNAADFIALVEEKGEDDLRLVDVEIATVPGLPSRYSGRFVPDVIPNWWGIGYTPPGLRRADWLLSRGYGTSGTGLDENTYLWTPESTPLQLLDLTAEVRKGGMIIQGKPNPDGGTAGPPK